jgi:hypothetical protein
MNEDTPSELLGRRMDRVLVIRRVVLWTHITLGILAGSACTGATLILVSRLSHRGGPSYTRGGGRVIAVAFLFAVLPLIYSYFVNVNREAATLTRVMVFLAGIIGISLLANVAVVWTLLTGYSAILLLLIYATQFSAYAIVGNVLLEPDPNSGGFDW